MRLVMNFQNKVRPFANYRDIAYEAKLSDLYKYCAEGWSIAMAETKAGLIRGTHDFNYYKDSEHYDRVRKVYRKKQHQFHKDV